MKNLLIIFIVLVAAGCGEQENFHFVKKGEGAPTVVFESGLGDDQHYWSIVQESISATTNATTISYDRLGLGLSTPTNKPRTLENLALELNQFLTVNSIKEPYILVGHSYGGFIVRKYQYDYPEKVAGLVLVDPSDELLWTQATDSIKNEKTNYISKMPQSIQNEFQEFENSVIKMRKISPPTSLPITLLVSYQENEFFDDKMVEIRKQSIKEWILQLNS